ncbi:MAG TPA: Mur ligase domain-containing protein, partial [Thermoclostridium caenicola]|nr:Mur ligase domain-containing protein [Thermoclostridium caenicola]
MKLKDLVESLELVEVRGGLDKEIRGVTYDSRKALPGYLFVCIDGFTTDGHKYAQQAVDNGACTLVVEKDIHVIGEDVTIIRVKNSREALALISANW